MASPARCFGPDPHLIFGPAPLPKAPRQPDGGGVRAVRGQGGLYAGEGLGLITSRRQLPRGACPSSSQRDNRRALFSARLCTSPMGPSGCSWLRHASDQPGHVCPRRRRRSTGPVEDVVLVRKARQAARPSLGRPLLWRRRQMGHQQVPRGMQGPPRVCRHHERHRIDPPRRPRLGRRRAVRRVVRRRRSKAAGLSAAGRRVPLARRAARAAAGATRGGGAAALGPRRARCSGADRVRRLPDKICSMVL
mmetsp:Transcript_25221/g.86470  ORF Transcript_25221/g.86470 Transcript_25221/m.86470 type:complete len:249 (-) Transcript_25221:795-1541(-)